MSQQRPKALHLLAPYDPAARNKTACGRNFVDRRHVVPLRVAYPDLFAFERKGRCARCWKAWEAR